MTDSMFVATYMKSGGRQMKSRADLGVPVIVYGESISVDQVVRN